MNEHLAGAMSTLEELHDDLIRLVTPLDGACLNWRPPMEDANSIAGLVRQTVGSLSMWLSRALDEPFERDRDAEFASHDTSTSLVAALGASRTSVRDRLVRLDGLDPGIVRRVRRLGPTEVSVTVAWCVAHVLRHSGEHWGQIQLNRDLYRA